MTIVSRVSLSMTQPRITVSTEACLEYASFMIVVLAFLDILIQLLFESDPLSQIIFSSALSGKLSSPNPASPDNHREEPIAK